MNLVDRAKKSFLTPQAEWEVINQESTSTSQLYTQYIVLLAAIGPVAMFLGGSFLGFGFFSLYGIVHSLVAAVFSYVLGLVGVFLVALVIDALAPSFGAQKNGHSAESGCVFFYPGVACRHISPRAAARDFGLAGFRVHRVPDVSRIAGLDENHQGKGGRLHCCRFCVRLRYFRHFRRHWDRGCWRRRRLVAVGASLGISITDSSGTTTVNVDGVKQLGANMDAASKQMDAAKGPVIRRRRPTPQAAALSAMAGRQRQGGGAGGSELAQGDAARFDRGPQAHPAGGGKGRHGQYQGFQGRCRL